MKLQNFKRFDPLYAGKGKVGLMKGSKVEKEVWDEFAADSAYLAQVAKAIRTAVDVHSLDSALAAATELDEFEAAEGRILTRLHSFRERSTTLVSEKKKQAIEQHGCLACEACGFNFTKKYGAAGAGLIEVHHTNPVHTLVAGHKTKLKELALLCANCHRVIHARSKWLSVMELRDAIHIQQVLGHRSEG